MPPLLTVRCHHGEIKFKEVSPVRYENALLNPPLCNFQITMLNHVLLFQPSNPPKDLDSDEDKWWWKDNCDKLLSTVHCKVLLSVNRFCLKRAEKPFVISKMNFEISILNQSSVDHYLQQWLLCRWVKLQMKSIRLRRQRVQLISVFRSNEKGAPAVERRMKKETCEVLSRNCS